MLPAAFRMGLKDAEFLLHLRHGKDMCCLVWSYFEAIHVEFDELRVNKNIFCFRFLYAAHWLQYWVLS